MLMSSESVIRLTLTDASFETSKYADQIKAMTYMATALTLSQRMDRSTPLVSPSMLPKEIVPSQFSCFTGINVNLTVNASDVNNIQVPQDQPEASQQKFDDISWTYFNGDGSSDNDVIATAQNSISGQYESQDAYQELSFTANDIPDFASFAIKIVMKSDNPSYVPKIQDMRTVASF